MSLRGLSSTRETTSSDRPARGLAVRVVAPLDPNQAERTPASGKGIDRPLAAVCSCGRVPPCRRAAVPPCRRAAVPPCRRAAVPPCRQESVRPFDAGRQRRLPRAVPARRVHAINRVLAITQPPRKVAATDSSEARPVVTRPTEHARRRDESGPTPNRTLAGSLLAVSTPANQLPRVGQARLSTKPVPAPDPLLPTTLASVDQTCRPAALAPVDQTRCSHRPHASARRPHPLCWAPAPRGHSGN